MKEKRKSIVANKHHSCCLKVEGEHENLMSFDNKSVINHIYNLLSPVTFIVGLTKRKIPVLKWTMKL